MKIFLAALVIAMMFIPSANAGKATLIVSPDPPLANQPNVLSGCGFIPLIEVEAYFRWNADFRHDWNTGIVLHATSDSGGCFSMEWTPPVIGLYGIWVEQVRANGREQSRGVKLLFTVLN